MFKTISKSWPQDSDMPERTYTLSMFRRVLDGTLYDKLQHAFQEEVTDGGEYIQLRKRRPSVRNNWCRTVVEDSTAMLFSEGHFPTIELTTPEERDQLARVLREARINEIMLDAANRGSIGSVVIQMQVLLGRVFFGVMDSDTLTPTWNTQAPDQLVSVTEKYKVKGSELRASGYNIPDDDVGANFWFQRVWDDQAETWFMPWKVSREKEQQPKVDTKRTVQHKLGFVPMVWIKNLPGGDEIDGRPTLCSEAIDCQIEADYQMSQAGRGLKFMSDPTLVIRQDEDGEPRIKGAANALMVGEGGDAKLLEINGSGVAAVMDYVKYLREIAIETMHGNKSSNEKISAAQSGRAMELMNQALIWLADKLRISYGEGALLDLAIMVIRAAEKIQLVYKDGSKVGKFDTSKPPTLRWPKWYSPTMQDLMDRANSLRELCNSGLMSRITAIKVLAAEYDIDDAEAEKALADADMKERNAGAQVQVKTTE